MNVWTIYFVVALFASVHGHMYLSSITIGGQDQGERNCLRPLYSGGAVGTYPNSPLQDLKVYTRGLIGANMTCGFLPFAANPANRKCPVTAGSVMGITWHHESTASGDMIVEESHKGPCMVYMAKSDDGSGPVWFKVYEEGYNTQTSTWCTMRLRATKGYLEFTIPATLPSGNYLIRTETFGLHEGNQMYGAQPYVGCAEVTVTGAASGTLPSSDYLVSFPGAYSYNDAGILFNVYNSFTSYPIPGPKLYTSSAVTNTGNPTSNPTSNTGNPTSNPTSTPTSTPTSNSASGNGCGDIASQCLQICGERTVASCKCLNGNPSIECADSSAASSLRPFWFL